MRFRLPAAGILPALCYLFINLTFGYPADQEYYDKKHPQDKPGVLSSETEGLGWKRNGQPTAVAPRDNLAISRHGATRWRRGGGPVGGPKKVAPAEALMEEHLDGDTQRLGEMESSAEGEGWEKVGETPQKVLRKARSPQVQKREGNLTAVVEKKTHRHDHKAGQSGRHGRARPRAVKIEGHGVTRQTQNWAADPLAFLESRGREIMANVAGCVGDECTCTNGSYKVLSAGCQPHRVCLPGWGVRRAGTAKQDVICHRCRHGTYSGEFSSTKRCQHHTRCHRLGLALLRVGNATNDNICHSGQFPMPSGETEGLIHQDDGTHLHEYEGFPMLQGYLNESSIEDGQSGDEWNQTSASHGLSKFTTFLESIEASEQTSAMASVPAGTELETTTREPVTRTSEPLFRETSPSLQNPIPAIDSFSGSGPISEIKSPQGNSEHLQSDDAAPLHLKPTQPGQDLFTPRSRPQSAAGMVKQESGQRTSEVLLPPSPASSTWSFDLNEHLAWMTVLLILTVLVLLVACSVQRSTHSYRRSPPERPDVIRQRAAQPRAQPRAPPPSLPGAPAWDMSRKWVIGNRGQSVDILHMVAAQVGSRWRELYNALSAPGIPPAVDEARHSSYQDLAYAALLSWSAVDPEASLAKLIGGLRRCNWPGLVESIRAIMDDTAGLEHDELGPLPSFTPARGHVGVVDRPADGGGLRPNHSGAFHDESLPLLRSDSTSSGSSSGSVRSSSFIPKEKRDTIVRQVLAEPADLRPVFDDLLSLLGPDEGRILEMCVQPEERLEKLFDIVGCKSREASQRLLDSLYQHLPELL
uniref:tumor necrosis factor receptor superfamily member 21 n=1 Tax=Myxine glutinosa TaxID=7769 RepID=UPI00358E71D4